MRFSYVSLWTDELIYIWCIHGTFLEIPSVNLDDQLPGLIQDSEIPMVCSISRVQGLIPTHSPTAPGSLMSSPSHTCSSPCQVYLSFSSHALSASFCPLSSPVYLWLPGGGQTNNLLLWRLIDMSLPETIIYMAIFNWYTDDVHLDFILDFQIDYKRLTQESQGIRGY